MSSACEALVLATHVALARVDRMSSAAKLTTVHVVFWFTVLLLGALAAMRGWHPALIGCDDLELAGAPAVAHRDRAGRLGLGRIAAELLFARISGDRRPTQRVVLPTRLVPRGSGEQTP